ncbi:hypothetical protein RDV89_02025 [Nocardioides zeae]|uniref:Uncharacterized protein n=1 Tax=Nocardioides imazamoxiresistens TaxID=3231893 RepID=A0ABU3PRI1_9ACTN|nr:hypothetical protein [Nocardioides zeae]MDT9591829.1 hypothetical protein [Nocardioides zeae]
MAALAGDVPAAVLALDDDVLDGDLPARSWARDWERVVATLEAYALDLETTGAGELRWPRTGDGWSILDRMASAEGGCTLPDAVAALDPTPWGPTADARFADHPDDP